ncbi:uncharacterized protein V6R79_015265 [Siganus canaliculatus]
MLLLLRLRFLINALAAAGPAGGSSERNVFSIHCKAAILAQSSVQDVVTAAGSGPDMAHGANAANLAHRANAANLAHRANAANLAHRANATNLAHGANMADLASSVDFPLFQDQQTPGLDQFPVDLYQNSCRLFWMVERLVQDSEVAYRVEVESEQSGFLRRLEQRVFLLSEEFPLFSVYMWRIGSLLTSSDK